MTVGRDSVPANRRGPGWRLGAVAIVVGLVALFGPFVYIGQAATLTVSQSHGLCSTELGQVAQAFSDRLAHDCQAIGAVWAVGWGVVAIGAIVVATTLVRWRRS